MPVALDSETLSRDGVALVAARIRNETPVPRRVRVENRLPGPVLPPRRRGRPEPGWDADGFAGVVAPGAERALGYACPVGDRDRPESAVELVSVGDPDGEPPDPLADALAACGPARPPRDAVPVPDGVTEERGADADDEPDEREPALEPIEPPDETPSPPGCADDPLPDGAAAALDAVERRIALGERLTGASIAEATDVLADAAVPPDVLARRLEADAAALRALVRRVEPLEARAADVDVPVAALGRLA